MGGALLSGFGRLAATEPVPLPGPLEGPLHFPSSPSCAWLAVWLLLLLGLAIWLGRLLWRRLRRRLQSRPEPRPAPPPVAAGAPGVSAAIADILDRNLRSGTYRQGCHELSAVLRAHWEARGLGREAGPRFTRMTAREIESRVGERPATRLLALLAGLQFGRREPSRNDFSGACKLAGETVLERGER